MRRVHRLSIAADLTPQQAPAYRLVDNRSAENAECDVNLLPIGLGEHEWRAKPSKPDNHWFDCLVGCAVAASMIGVKVLGEGATTRQRKRYTQEDLRRRYAP